MSDYEKLKELLTSFGVGFTEKTHEDRLLINCAYGSAKVTGYIDFLTSFEFDQSGKFIEVGAWE